MEDQPTKWNPETLAAVAGMLRTQCPHVDTYEVIRAVWSIAHRESPHIGGLRLLARVRAHIAGAIDAHSTEEGEAASPVASSVAA